MSYDKSRKNRTTDIFVDLAFRAEQLRFILAQQMSGSITTEQQTHCGQGNVWG